MDMAVYFACNVWLTPVNIQRRDSLLEELMIERLMKNVGVVIYTSFQSSSYNDKSRSAFAGLALATVRCRQPPTDAFAVGLTWMLTIVRRSSRCACLPGCSDGVRHC